MKNHSSSPSSGFTLVELSIVMVIIGLLIGGVLKGQELILNARIKSTIAQVKSYQAATLTFQDSYRSMPGDIRNPQALIPGCATTAHCAGGNGNGLIGTPNVSNWSHDDQSGLATEPTQFWLHLQLADLITGVSGRAIQQWGEAYPAAPIGGGFEIFHASETGINQAQGHYMMLKPFAVGDPHPVATSAGWITPNILSRIDTMMDDGIPNTGSVIADDALGCWNSATGRYASSDAQICISAFKFY